MDDVLQVLAEIDALVPRTLKSPLFVVGSPRSGTSILIAALLAAGYTGYEEGNFLPLIRPIEVAIDLHFKTYAIGDQNVLAAKVDQEAFRNDILQVFKRCVDHLNPVSPWVDKSGNPEMIEAIPTLQELWPPSIFIFSKRRAIENIISRVKKFPQYSFDYHCRDWARNMSAWREVRDSLGASAIEVDQQDLVKDPRGAAARIGGLIGADDAARELMYAEFTQERPQQTSEGSAGRIVDLGETGWSARQIEVFTKYCAEEMDAYNYSLSAAYWA